MTVEVRLIGHLGNNLFEYALGRIIAEHLGQELIVHPATDMPGWANVERMSGIVDRLHDQLGYFADVPLRIEGKVVDQPQMRLVLGEFRRWNGHAINLPHVLEHGKDHRIVLRGYFQRTEYYQPHKARIKSWFKLSDVHLPITPGPRDVVVHIRRSLDMFVLDRALDLSYYHDLLAGLTFDKVLVCGLGIDERVKSALAEFDPTYLDLEAIPSLFLLTRASRIVLANSTFSWWGAYLSEATDIYFPRPVRSIWSPERPEIALEVDEPQYRYVDRVPVERWRPFRLDERRKLVFETASSGSQAVRISGPGVDETQIEIPAALEAAVERIISFRRRFGLLDFDDLEFSPAARRELLRLLAALERTGALQSEPGTFRALEGAMRRRGRHQTRVNK